MTGETAQIGINAGFPRCFEAKDFGLPLLEHLGMENDLLGLGNELSALGGLGILGHLIRRQADFLKEPGWTRTKLCGVASGLLNSMRTGWFGLAGISPAGANLYSPKFGLSMYSVAKIILSLTQETLTLSRFFWRSNLLSLLDFSAFSFSIFLRNKKA